MRVAYVCADRGVPPFGQKGSSVHVQEVIRALRRRGGEVSLFATRPGRHVPPDLADVEVHPLPRPPREPALERERGALAANRELRKGLRRNGPFDLIYERHSLFCYAAMEFARARGVPGLLEVNAPLIEEQRRYRGLRLQDEAETAAARAFAAAQGILCVSEGVAQALRPSAPAPDRVHVVPNGVNTERFGPHVEPGRHDPESFTVGFVGSLKPWHGAEGLVEAFAELHRGAPDARLLVVGDGPRREALQKRAAELELGDAVTWTGRVTPDEVPGLVASMDVTVAPYPDLEAFYFSPLKVFEYMAAGRAIVAAAIGQVTDVLRDGETALLYPPGDIRALAACLDRLRREHALRRRLGETARDAAVRDHRWDTVAARILELAELESSHGAMPQKVS